LADKNTLAYSVGDVIGEEKRFKLGRHLVSQNRFEASRKILVLVPFLVKLVGVSVENFFFPDLVAKIS
jgi:hypothetical protein